RLIAFVSWPLVSNPASLGSGPWKEGPFAGSTCKSYSPAHRRRTWATELWHFGNTPSRNRLLSPSCAAGSDNRTHPVSADSCRSREGPVAPRISARPAGQLVHANHQHLHPNRKEHS